MEIRQLNFDVSRGGVQHRLFVRAGDAKSRTIIAKMYSGSEEIAFSSALIRVLGTDGAEHLSDCTVSENTVSYTLTTEDIGEGGEVLCEFVLSDVDGAVMTSPQFIVVCEKLLFTGEGAESSDEYAAYIAALMKIDNLSVSANSGDVASATVGTNENGGIHIDFVLPKGDKGDAFEYEDFTEEQLAALKGEPGADGDDYVLTEADKEEVAEIAAENVVNDYAIRETICIGLDGYCYSKDGVAYSINNLNIETEADLKKYNFVLIYEYETTETYIAYVPLVATISGFGDLYFSAIYYTRGSLDTDVYVLTSGYVFFESEEAINFTTVNVVGDYITDYYGTLSVNKTTLLGDIGDQTMKEYTDGKIGDIETALDGILAIQNSLIGGGGE